MKIDSFADRPWSQRALETKVIYVPLFNVNSSDSIKFCAGLFDRQSLIF